MSSLLIHVKKTVPKPTIVFDTYWKFACARQNIYFKRLKGESGPWTTDPILKAHKFTNAYRASDRVSQYLIGSVIYNGSQSTEDLFLRILLFKIFNKIETWQHLESTFGEITAKSFRVSAFAKALERLKNQQSIYSAAYIMPSGGGLFPSKHLMHLHLLKKMLQDGLPSKIANSKTMEQAFNLLKAYPTIGDFLAYQFVTDLNYSTMTNFSEMEFVVPGPGARNGLKKCFSSLGDYTESEAIRYVTESQHKDLNRLGLIFKSLGGRDLQLIDCQNIFCETDKYSRVAHPEFKGVNDRTRIKQKFSPHDSLERPFYPPKWGINSKVAKQIGSVVKNSRKRELEAAP